MATSELEQLIDLGLYLDKGGIKKMTEEQKIVETIVAEPVVEEKPTEPIAEPVVEKVETITPEVVEAKPVEPIVEEVKEPVVEEKPVVAETPVEEVKEEVKEEAAENVSPFDSIKIHSHM